MRLIDAVLRSAQSKLADAPRPWQRVAAPADAAALAMRRVGWKLISGTRARASRALPP